jgi:PAS domain S-box-containing protein
LALYESATEIAYLNGDFELMEKLVEIVLQEAKTVLDKVKVYEAKIQSRMAQSQQLEAVKIGLQVLEIMGVSLPESPTTLDIQQALSETMASLNGKSMDDLLNLPLMKEPDKLATMHILASMSSPTYQAAPALFPLIVLSQVNLSIKYGNSIFSTYGYVSYGAILNGVVLDMEAAYQFRKLSLDLVEKLNALEIKTTIFFVAGSCTVHGKVHARETLPLLLEGYQSGLENGQLEYGSYAAMPKCQHSYFIGQELTVLEREMAKTSNALTQAKKRLKLDWNRVFHQAVLTLLNPSNNPCSLPGEIYNEEKLLSLLRAANDRTGLHYFYVNKLMLCYLFGEYPQALENATQAQQYLDGVTAFLVVPVFHFYDSLTRLAVYSSVPNSEQERLLLKVASNQEKMQKWAHHAPMNYLHKFELVEAEQHRVLGDFVEAMDYYDRAIAGAKENEYLNEEALAHELAAKFYLEWGKQTIAKAYLTNAYYAYARWGAKAKVEDLEKRYPSLLASILTQKTSATTQETCVQTSAASLTSSSTENSSGFLDFATVIKASQAISGEVQLDKLLSTLVQIAIENAGAKKGVLLLEKSGNLVIEATGISGTKEATVLQSIPVEQSQEIPVTLINYVYRTSKTLVLDDASVEKTFSADPYIIGTQPKSVLCTPIINQGQRIGILYLENNLATKAFTPERLEVLKILSGQAAISINNAKLYAQVKESQSQLTQFLSAIPVGVSVHEPNGKLYYANQAAQELMGINTLPEAETEQLSQAYHVYRAGTHQLYPTEQLPIVRSLHGERVNADDLELYQPDKIIPLEISTTPIFDKTGKLVYAIAAFQDITQRKQAEKLIAEYNRTLEEQVQERTAQLAEANQEISALNERLKAENLRLSAELEVTRKLQQMILPKQEELESIEGLDIAGFMEPADEVGGDYYDVLQQDGKVKIGIGDVTGHGLESGVLMLMTQTAVRTLQESNQTDPVQFLDILNRTIYRNAQRINPDKSLTLALLDYADGLLSVSGQHEEIIIVRTGGQIELIDTINLGFSIGLDDEIADFIASFQVHLNPGDVVVLYTDGITEAFDINRQQLISAHR